MNRGMRTRVGLCVVAVVLLHALLTLGTWAFGAVRGGQGQPAPEVAGEAGANAVDDAALADAEREAFVSTWAERIDAFNAGYPLEGYGRTFAEAAYDEGIDPRYSPAIARVESGSGQACSYSCNAWGWGAVGWSDWDTAIRAHVAGLAEGYGHTLTYDAALSYNEETPDEWYAQVEACMYQIWESEEL